MRKHSLFFIFYLTISLLASAADALTPQDIPIQKCAINRTDKRKGAIAICAMFRDEAPFLKEWIEYHRLVGVTHFYLYNNCSQDDFWVGVLKRYVDEGIVELFDVPFDSSLYNDGAKTHNFVQVCCYNHALNLAKGFNNWLGLIDLDEFICPVVDKDLPTILKRYDYAAGLVVYWQVYGTSNIWDLNPGELMLEKLLLRQPNQGGNGIFKSIVKPQAATCIDPHCCSYVAGAFSVMPNHQRFSHTPGFSELPVDLIRINHYTFRTEMYYQTVKKPRRKQWGENHSPEGERVYLDWANSVYDPVMMRFVPALKERMKR